MDSLANRVVIVTGGAGGIGSATAQLFAEKGARVVVADIAEAAARDVADRIGGGAIAFGLDLADETSIEAMFEATLSAFGRLDVLDNNAAALSPDMARRDGDIEHMENGVWDRAFLVNTRGAMIACRRALKIMSAQRSGAIVNVASNLALQGHVIQAAYSASKAALIQMTRSIATSHGRLGIRCNAVLPGLTGTPAALSHLPPRLLEIVAEETPTPYLGAPVDIAEAVVFLASDAARYVNGHCLVADGGTTIHTPGYARLSEFFSSAEKAR
jgi:NAD(P)-dependent dehydrogenase (short-subunit alcohol dehydrogenase family)